MAKDLSGTNIATQKEAAHNTPVFLVEVVRDHPETGESILYAGSWTKFYTIDGHDYLDLIAPNGMGDLRQAIAPGGGIATISDWVLSLINPDDAGGFLSDMLDDYFLEFDTIRLKLVFVTGLEIAADILTLFVGQIQDLVPDTRIFQMTAKDGTRSTLKTIPQEMSDLIEFPNIPLDNINKSLPWVFGVLNVEPFNTSGSRARLAPCICVDKFDMKYTAGRLCKTYGQPYVYYRTAMFYVRIEDYTQTGDFFTIDSSSRFSKIKPVRAIATNDVATWRNAIDGNTSTGATIINGSNLDLQFRGSPKIGTITDIKVVIVASGGYDYTVSKLGEADISNSAIGNVSIDLDGAGWDFSSTWDFEQIQVYFDGTGNATINLITLDITFDEQESGDQIAFPMFQAVTGFEDIAAYYQDGGVINGAGTALTIPMDVLLAFMRAKRSGMRMPITQIHTANLATERAKISDWKFDFSLSSELEFDGLSELIELGKMRLFRNYNAEWKISVFDKTADPVGYFSNDWNILVTNPDAPADGQESSMQVYLSPINEIHNEFVFYYGWDEALGEFTEVKVSSPYYRVSGTCTLNLAAGTLTDLSATFQTDGIQVGYKAFVVRDQLYQLDAINSETELDISTVEPGGEISDGHTDSYYIGPNFDYQCFRSVQKYKLTQRRTIESKYIQDDNTAEALIEHLVEYWSGRRWMCTFRTALNTIDLELADLIIVDHYKLPPRKRPTILGVLDADVTSGDTALPMVSPGYLLAREGDILVIKSATDKMYAEVVTVTGIDEINGEVDVDRAQAGTVARAWDAGDEVYRAITKFEIVEIKNLSGGVPVGANIEPPANLLEIEITARETLKDYTPTAYIAPEGEGADTFSEDPAEDRARYLYVCYPNGEVVWLDEDSEVGVIASA